MSHPAVQEYKDNKELFDQYYFLSYIDRSVDRFQVFTLKDTVEYRNLMLLCKNFDPFHNIRNNIKNLSVSDLDWLVDNMPSGSERALCMHELDRKISG